MTAFVDLKPGLYRAQWLNAIPSPSRFTVMHKFQLIGHGPVWIPGTWINVGEPELAIDCNDWLSMEVGPTVERTGRNGYPFTVRRVKVRLVPA